MNKLVLIILISLASCKQAQMPSEEKPLTMAKAPTETATIARERVYAISTSQNTLGFDIDAECNSAECRILGKIYNYTGMEKTDGINFVDSHSEINIGGALAHINNGIYAGTINTGDYFSQNSVSGMSFYVIYDSHNQILKLRAWQENNQSVQTCISNDTTVSKEEFDAFKNSTIFWTGYPETDNAGATWESCNI